MRWRLILYALIGFAVIIILHFTLPSQHNPYREADLNEPIGLATYDKLTHLKYNPILCERKLSEAGIGYEVLPPDENGSACALDETYVLTRSLTPYNAAPLRMSCHQLAALYIWEKNIARPQAEKIFGSPLRQIETYGSFSCRNIAGTQQKSQHAFANAIDISGFVLEDGRRISVKQHWREDSDLGKYLTRVHKGACKLFSVTLGPDYNAAHADHFHLDMGSTETCR